MAPLYIGLVYTVWFLSIFFVVLVMLLLGSGVPLFERRQLRPNYRPLVSILVPAYNEQGKIHKTIESLKRLTYEAVQIIVLNDGSKDQTSEEVRQAIGDDARFTFIDNRQNKGKAATLNQGIALAKGDFIATMDADSCIEPSIMEKSLPYFDADNVGAVTVSVKVKDPKTFLERIIEIEYLIGLSLFLKVFSAIDCVFVTPGPFSVYRKSLLDKIGGFDPKNIVEDHEIAYRIHKEGFKIRNCMEATVETILPPTFKGLYVQRRRWYSGAVRTLMQHRKMCFKSEYGLFAYFAPFNQVLIFFGLLLFGYTTYLGISNLVENITYFSYVDLDLWARLKEYSFDMFRIQKTWLFGTSSLLASIGLLWLGVKKAGIEWRSRKVGLFGYVFMFFLYQVFWIGAYLAVLKGGKIKWR